MATSLSNLANNLADVIHKIKCIYGHDNKRCETCGIKYKYCKCCLDCTRVKDDLIEYKWLRFNKNYQKRFEENL